MAHAPHPAALNAAGHKHQTYTKPTPKTHLFSRALTRCAGFCGVLRSRCRAASLKGRAGGAVQRQGHRYKATCSGSWGFRRNNAGPEPIRGMSTTVDTGQPATR